MKKLLGLLFISSSMFSMQLAYKMPVPRLDRVKSAVVKQQKAIISQANQVASKVFDTPKVYIPESSIRAPHTLSDTKLYHGKKGFTILHNEEKHVIEKRFMDPIARNLKKEQLKSFLKKGYFELNQNNYGDFTLKANHRLTGGGPVFGTIMYWVTKSLCYGTAAAAVGGAVVATGGAVAGAMASTGTAAAVSGAVVTKTATAVAATKATGAIIVTAKVSTVGATIASTTGVVTAGAGMAGAVASGAGTAAIAIGAADALGVTVAGVGVGQAAAMTTAVGVTVAAGSSTAATVGTVATVTGGIEALSVAVGTFFGMLPTP